MTLSMIHNPSTSIQHKRYGNVQMYPHDSHFQINASNVYYNVTLVSFSLGKEYGTFQHFIDPPGEWRGRFFSSRPIGQDPSLETKQGWETLRSLMNGDRVVEHAPKVVSKLRNIARQTKP